MANPDSLSASTTVVANENCLSTTLEGEAVILHTDAGKYYGFNEVGTYIWERLQQPYTVEEVCQAVSSEYDVARDQCQDDVHALLIELLEYELVHTIDDESV